MAASKPKPAALRNRNRDHERLYRPGLLSKWFLLFSVLLLVAIVAMVWKDYARPWKDYQKAFFEKELEIARDEARAERNKVFTLEGEVQAARKAVDDAWTALQATRDPMTHEAALAQRHEQKRLMDAADANVKGVKGLLAPARYTFETRRARLEKLDRLRAADLPERPGGRVPSAGDIEDARAKVEAAREPVLRYGQALFEAEDRFLAAAGAWQDTARLITRMEQPWTLAKKTLADLLSKKAMADTKLQGLEALHVHNSWRNAPFIDFISPSIKVRQQVLDDIHDNWNVATNKRVDRCTTCHLGADVPAMGDRPAHPDRVTKYDLPNWMQAHPGLELIAGPASPHKVERFGCSVCHHGVGWATDFSRAAHLPKDAETEHRWKEEHHWHEPHYIEYPMLPTAYTEGQCWKCHKDGIAWPVHYEERLDHGYIAGGDPLLGTDADGKPVQLGQYRYPPEDPRFATPANRLLGPWEVHTDFALPAAPQPTYGTMADVIYGQQDQIYGAPGYGNVFEAYEPEVFDRWVERTVHDYDWRAETYDRGYDSIVTYGCQGCHTIADFGQQVGSLTPPRVGPSLTTIKDKVRPEFLPKWIQNPGTFRPDTKMPSFFWFVDTDATWTPQRNADGSLRILPVMDAHMLDPKMALELGAQTRPEDEDMMHVQILAMAAWLQNHQDPLTGKPSTRRDPADPATFNPDYLEVLPEGDIERGRTLVNEKGCTACHVVPEVYDGSAWVEDGTERFDHDPLKMKGPRLVGLGSKLLADGAWLNAWLKNPRHYTATTSMPDMRLEDKFDAQGVQVADGAQMRADIIAYLMASKNEEFEAQPELGWRPRYEPILREMVETFFGKDRLTGEWIQRDVIAGGTGALSGQALTNALARVGERLMARNGCFGCHAVEGHEDEQPIGVELTEEGSKDLHQLDFGVVPRSLVPHTRWDFFYNKIRTPRVWDSGKLKPWADKLRMPRFNLWSPPEAAPPAEGEEAYPGPVDTRHAITAMVSGFTADKLQPGILATPDAAEADLIAGRRVIKRYGCNQCHTIEGQAGLFWFQQSRAGVELAMLPPNLFGQGYRTRTEWLVKFLKDPQWLRPIVKAHMPNFHLADEEAMALARYFLRLAGPDVPTILPQPDSKLAGHRYPEPITIPAEGERPAIGPITGWLDEARGLFETINCNKCHLPKGTPGADPNDGGVAPSFSLSAERLRHLWVEALLYNPGHLINGTKMPQFYPMQRSYGRQVPPDWQPYQFWLRDDAAWREDYASEDEERRTDAVKRLAEVQIRALTDYLLHHYRPPAPPAGPVSSR